MACGTSTLIGHVVIPANVVGQSGVAALVGGTTYVVFAAPEAPATPPPPLPCTEYRIKVIAAAPANPGDECSTATNIPSLPFTEVVVVADFTTNPSDPDTTCEIGGGGPFAKVGGWWYTFTATANANITVKTCNSTGGDPDSVIGIYTGACGALTEIACDDDTCAVPGPFGRATVTFAGTMGTTYTIFVDNYSGGEAGDITVEVTSP